MSNFGKFMAGALVGGAVGAAIGMLLAPRSGAETRELIREEFETRSRDVADSVREKGDVLREKAAAFKEKLGELSQDFEEAGKKAVSRFTDKSSETPSAPTP